MRDRKESKFSLSLNHTHPHLNPEGYERELYYSNSVLSVYKSNPLIKITETGKKVPEIFVLGPEDDFLDICIPDEEKKSDYESIASWNIPRVWLRHKYKEDYRWGTLLHYVLLPFNQLNQIVQPYSWEWGVFYFAQNFDLSIDFGLSKDDLGMFKKGLRKNPKKFSTRFSILFCLLLRISVSYTLHNESTDPKLRMVLHLFMDTHIDLVNAISLHNSYADSRLLDENRNKESLVLSLYKMYYPHDLRFYHSGDLPDLTSIISLGGLWYSCDVKSGPKSIVHALIHVLSSKTQSYRCQGRNNMKILREDYFPKFPQMLELYKEFIRISLLGNYIFCGKRPSFGTRMKIQNFFNDFSDQEIIQWMSENELIVKYTTKEYFDYLVKCTYSLDQIFSGEPTRQKVSEITIETMDDIRKLYDSFQNPFAPDPTMQNELKKIYANCHNSSEPYISKLKKGRFDEVIFEACERAAQTMVVDQNSTKAVSSESELDESVLVAMEMVIDKHYIIDKNPIGKEVDVRCFKMFGMSKMGYCLLKNLIYDYIFNDMADSAICHSITDIFKTNSRDFYILHTFFSKLFAFYDSVEYTLPKEYADSQIKALRAKYRIHPWEDMPKYVGTFYYCEICKEWSHSTVTQITPESARGVYAIGTENCLFDITKQRLVCGNQPVFASIKKLKESGKYFEETTENLKDAKIIRKYKTTEKCSETPLVAIDMIGKVKCLDGKLWALCQICASLTHFSPSNFGSLGFTCGCHDRTREEFAYLRRVSQFKSGISFLKTCFYCQETYKTAEIITIRALDDKGDCTIKDLYICAQDYERCKSLLDHRTDVVRKSKVFEMVGSARTRSIESRMTKQFPRKP